MSAGNVKVSLLLELKNRLRAGLGTAKKYLNTEVGQMKAKLNELKVAHSKAFKSMQDEIPGFGRAMQLLGNPYVVMTAGLVALSAALFKASQLADQFDTSMAKANVTAQESPEGLKKTGNRILNYAANSSLKGAAQAAPDAYNVLLSSGLDKETALAGVAPSLDAAKAGFTDVRTAAQAASAVMNSSGVKDTTKVYDVLFATMRAGNAEFQDIAQYLPKIIPSAKSVGVSLEEVSGAFAYLTAQGQTTERATTLLENAMKVLGDPEKEKAFKRLGIAFYDQSGKMRSLADISGDLNTKLTGLTDKKKATVLDSLGLDMEARSAFLAMSEDAGKLKSTISETSNSTGQLKAALENSKTPMDSWVVISNKIEVAFIKVGQVVNEVLGGLGQWLLDNSGLLETFAYLIGGVAIAWGGYLLAANAASIYTGILTGAQWLLNAALNANPIGLIVTAIGLLIGGLIIAYQKSEKFRAILAGIMEVAKLIGDVFIGLGKTIIGAFTFNPKMFLEGVAQSASATAKIANGGLGDAYNKGYDSSIKESELRAKKEEMEARKKAMEEEEKKKSLYGQGKPTGGTPPGGTPPGGKLPKGDAGVNKVTGQSQQSKVINITIKSFVENFSSKHEELRNMSKRELERWFVEMLNRTIHGIDTSYE